MKFRQGLLGRSALAVLLVAGSMAVPVLAHAETVVVEGNRRVDSETIRSYFVGADANEAVKKLYATGNFSDVEVSHRGGTLVVRVVENATIINHVVFVGNSKVKSEDIEKEIQSRNRGGFNQATVDADVQRIISIYQRAGRSGAKVTARTVQTPKGSVDVVFTIDEGDKTGIKSIRFVGNHVFSESKLLGLMETTEMNYLSFLKSSDVYDPDRLAKDAEAIRKYYLRNGYADFRVIGEDAVYDAAQGGYVVTITLEEGGQYTVGSVTADSHLRDVPSDVLEPLIRLHTGDIYDGDAVQKTVDRLTKEVGKRGYAFTQIRPRGDRDPANHLVNVVFIAEDGPRVYVERINVHGNSATRDYVIRREFELGEGDAYNKSMVDKAERRLNSLGYFKKVKITNQAGSSSDRVIIDVDVEEQSTGNFSVSGGYSTTQGWLAEVAVTQSNLLGRGDYIRTSVSYGQYSRGFEVNYTEPFFLDQRLAAGIDAYTRQSMPSPYAYYSNWVSGGTLRLGIPITDEVTLGVRYTGYYSQLTIPNTSTYPYNDCGNTNTFDPVTGVSLPSTGTSAASGNQFSCLTNGEASLALKQAQGGWVTSMVGYTLSYNTLDRPRDPHIGILGNFSQDIAGAGGDSKFVRTTGDLKAYHELYFDDIVGLVHLQAGNLTDLSNQPLRVVDNFNLGQTLVRGFAPGGIGPRDITNTLGGTNQGNALGGTNYWGASLEAQFPIWGIPRDIGLKGAIFADAGSLLGYKGLTNFGGIVSTCTKGAPLQGSVNGVTQTTSQACQIQVGGDGGIIRSSVGLGIIWASPMGPIRFNYAFALSKSSADITQGFSFSGGTTF